MKPRRHEFLLFDAAPEREIRMYQPEWQRQEVYSFYAAPGSEIKAGSLVTVDGSGYIKIVSAGDWIFGYAVLDMDADGHVRVCGDPRMVEWPTA